MRLGLTLGDHERASPPFSIQAFNLCDSHDSRTSGSMRRTHFCESGATSKPRPADTCRFWRALIIYNQRMREHAGASVTTRTLANCQATEAAPKAVEQRNTDTTGVRLTWQQETVNQIIVRRAFLR